MIELQTCILVCAQVTRSRTSQEDGYEIFDILMQWAITEHLD